MFLFRCVCVCTVCAGSYNINIFECLPKQYKPTIAALTRFLKMDSHQCLRAFSKQSFLRLSLSHTNNHKPQHHFHQSNNRKRVRKQPIYGMPTKLCLYTWPVNFSHTLPPRFHSLTKAENAESWERSMINGRKCKYV